MRNEHNIWSTIKRILLVANFENIESVVQWRESLKSSGLNVHNCRILSIVTNKKERLALKDMGNVTFIAEGDFNIIGRLKNEDAKKILHDNFDAILIVGECPKRILKAVNKVKSKLTIGLNTGLDDRMINLESAEKSKAHLVGFVKQTLERIS